MQDNPADKVVDEPRRSQREVTFTEKGLSYKLDIIGKERHSRIKALSSISDQIKQLLAESLDTALVKTAYADWLSKYEELLSTHEEYQSLLALTERHVDDDEFQKDNSYFLDVKRSVEEWFSRFSVKRIGQYSASRMSSRSSSRTSQLSQAKLIESQRKAELLARTSALAEKQAIETEKLKLKLKEEELKLKTELRVSDAKTKVLEELERSELRDRELEDFLAANVSSNRYFETQSTPYSKGLNPNAAVWTAGHTHNIVEGLRDTPHISTAIGDSELRSYEVPVHTHDVSSNTHISQEAEHRPAPEAEQCPVPFATTTRSSNNDDGGILIVARELNKPKADIQKFDGNPMEYNRFLRQFNVRIEANTESYDERLSFLMQFTTGEAHKIVSGYSHLNAKRGYTAALEEFKDRYGDPDVVAHAYVKKALDWPVIKPDSAKALDEYAIFLRECQFAVENVEAGRVLEYSENLKLLVKKLPYYLHEKWRNIVYVTREKKEIVKFQLLVNFVRKEAKKAIDPIYGKEVMSASNSANKQSNDNRHTRSTKFAGSRKNFATTAVETTKGEASIGAQNNSGSPRVGIAFAKPCLYCQSSSHSLDSCTIMMKQSLKDRYAFLKAKGLCFACLSHGHLRGSCRQRLCCVHCKKCHPSVLHLDSRQESDSKPVSAESSNDSSVLATSSATHTGAGGIVHQALPVVPVRLKSKHSDKYVETYAFLDSGSTATFCLEDLMAMLNVEGKKTKLNLLTMGQERVQSSYVISGLEISSLDGKNVLELPPVFTQSTLPVSRKDITSSNDLQDWSHLSDIPLDHIDGEVGLLIGVNVPKAMEPWDVIPSAENGPFAVKTLLGWVINGPLDIRPASDVASRYASVNRIDVTTVPSLEEQVRYQFNHDFNERTIDDVLEPSREDRKFLDIVSTTTDFEDGHYVINLPFKSETVSMPNNRKQAEQRLASLAKRLDRDDGFRSEYINFMNKIISEGYAQKVPCENVNQTNGQTWYLPHHGVYHPKKKKLRVVFDCAAKFQGTSLNDQLLQGPNLTNTLVGTLIRFRLEEIAVVGDIESMFYQVRLPPRDASFLRFLWWENGDTNKPATEYQMVVHLFGATSSPSCANFALRKTAQDCKDIFGADVIDTVLRNFYVDDCLKSVATVDDAISLVRNLQDLLKCGGFRIAKWISNSREVMNSIPVSERVKEVQDLDLDQDILPMERALGVQWCVESDVFCYKIVMQGQPLTRRGILSMVSSVYDPLGFLAPFVIKAKGILQELCKLNLGWDQQIPESLEKEWCAWLHDIQKLSDFKVDRCVKPKGFGTISSAQLHHFADASEIGYGTVTYLRLENGEGKVHCSFVIGKSRVAPLKQTTIPRLELTAATVSVRVDKMLRNELDIKIDRTVFWTDSMAVLRYIRNTTSRFKTFVANRLAVIHEGSTPEQWRYVNTKLNPADYASRGLSVEMLLQRRHWIEAPSFLCELEDQWPETPSEVSEVLCSGDPEVKKVVVRAVVATSSSTETDVEGVNRLINYHSSWFALKRSVAWILKVRNELLRRARCKGKSNSDGDSTSNVRRVRVSVQDLNDAEKAILKFIQGQAFPMEIKALGKEQSQVKSSSYIRRLDPVMDDGLLRVGGRLHKSSMPTEMKHPVILPKKHPVSTLILRQIHQDLQHSGRNHMLSHLRQRYWLPSAPSAIRKMISKCVRCRHQRLQVGEQKMANLPEDRVTADEPPFTRVGVDYFGPFEVKQRRCRLKRYGVIFTCLASRAVHLEVAASLDTDSYINALRRFIARRGQVTNMRSDNGTNFVGAEHELKRAINDWNLSQIHASMLQRNVDWQFNPPSGSHHGGVWERMIRSVRKAMNSVLREQTLDDEGLHTLMCEIESTINDRPITNNSDQHCDLEALTPNHLLLMKRKPNLPPGVFCKTDNYCKRRWRQIQYMANLFWQRWLREYLPLLQERQKWHDKKRNLKVGDVVLIVDSNAPRNSWPMGLVLETIPDKLGFVRQVKVKTATNVLVRPIDKLCVLLELD